MIVSGYKHRSNLEADMTTRLELSTEDIAIFKDERYSHPVPLVQRRMEALWLKGKKMPHVQIAELVGVSNNTLTNYFQLYRDKGIEGLKTVKFNKPQSELCTQITTLEKYFKEHPPATIKQAQHEIETLTGIKRSDTQVRMFLKKTQFKVSQDRNATRKGRSGSARGIS